MSDKTDVLNARTGGESIEALVQRFVIATLKADGVDGPTADQGKWAMDGIGEAYRQQLTNGDEETIARALKQLKKLEADVEQAAKRKESPDFERSKVFGVASVSADAGGEGPGQKGAPVGIFAQQHAERDILHPVTEEAPGAIVRKDGKVLTHEQAGSDPEAEKRHAVKEKNIHDDDKKHSKAADKDSKSR
jgi:hypothetical protein